MARKLLYPEPLIGTLPTVSLGPALIQVDDFETSLPMAYRVPLLFSEPARLTVRVSSFIGSEKDWCRAGAFAQVLRGLPGAPKKQVKRLYLDEAFFELDGAGYDYYVEFWPYRWITDYYFELWAQQL